MLFETIISDICFEHTSSNAQKEKKGMQLFVTIFPRVGVGFSY